MNVLLLRASRGRLGNSFLGRPVLLLTTTGHKSGRDRTQPLFYVEENGLILLVAANGGSPEDPLWLKNIKTHPKVRISQNGREQSMLARIAQADERAILWPKMVLAFPYWQEVADRGQRIFPVVILEQNNA
ncbi:MAG: nitroreductase family deazaflavin-dependent oxidoreductase [Sterolibacterium sp.]|nr:nitroreductase family deazaflavin-dependent oxidoreductase [Sterolibacterium sp.]